MPIVIINTPPESCSLAELYKLLASWGDTDEMRKNYSNALKEHLKSCKNCKEYNEYQKNRKDGVVW
jgi:hypothetical protein